MVTVARSVIGVDLRVDIVKHADALAAAFQAHFGKPLRATDGNRSNASQIRLFKANYSLQRQFYAPGKMDRRRWDNRLWYRKPGCVSVAPPGTSLHEGGRAIDFASNVNVRGSKEHAWMVANAPRFGFTWITGRVIDEAWHFEFEGIIVSSPTSKGIDMADLPVVKKGTSGAPAKRVQALLNVAGASLTVDGKFQDRSVAALEAFQKKKKLTADGVCGENTWAKLLGV